MRTINYDRFMRYIQSNPSYEVHEVQGIVEVTFRTPTVEEAMGSEPGEEEPNAMIRIILERRGDELILREAWVEREGIKHPLSLDSFDTWLDFVNMFSE